MKKTIMNNLFMFSVSTMIVLGILLIALSITNPFSKEIQTQEEIEQSEKKLQK